MKDFKVIALLPLFFFFFISNMHVCKGARHEPLQMRTTTTKFIKDSCGVTMYPKLCFKSLSAYASTIQTSPTQLANVALSVSLTCTRSTWTVVSQLSRRHDMKPREAAAVMDCVENIGDSVSELQQSLEEMRHIRSGEGSEYSMQMGNIETWVSAALTNEDTCMDGFEGNSMNGSVKSIVRSNIENVAQLTSNALALINSLSKLPNKP